MAKIFEGLESLGFSNYLNIDLYKKEESFEIVTDVNTSKQHLFFKEVTCPVCGNIFKTPAVKVNSPRIISKDSDFFIRYAVINPYFYEVWVCNNCGYSALKSDYNKIRNFQIDLIKENISPKWKGRTYDDIFDVKIAIERYKLALLNTTLTNGKNSTKAILCLKLAWMHRLIHDTEKEIEFISKSLEGLKLAYYNESFPIYGLNKYSTCFLMGELNRRIGNNSEALTWLSQVIVTPGVSAKIKDLARDSKDLIKK